MHGLMSWSPGKGGNDVAKQFLEILIQSNYRLSLKQSPKPRIQSTILSVYKFFNSPHTPL